MFLTRNQTITRGLLGGLFLVSSAAHAAGGRHEILLNAGSLSKSPGDSNIQLSPGYNFQLFSWMQVGGVVSFSSTSYKDTSVMNLAIIAGPTFNLAANVENAFFISGGLAIKTGSSTPDSAATAATTAAAATTTTTAATTTTATPDPGGVGYALFVGKRFPIAGSICYRPSFGAISTGTMAFVFNALAISVHF